MRDWQQKLDGFSEFNEHPVLSNAGYISKKQADDHARHEYEKFEVKRREYIENQAEAEYMKNLEQTAKQLPERKPGKQMPSADKPEDV